jgi:hypothetical protein
MGYGKALSCGVAAVVLCGCLTAPAAEARRRSKPVQPSQPSYYIMAPEPGTFPGVIPPRRSMAHPLNPSKHPRRTVTEPTAIPQPAPPIVVPGVAQPIPNMAPLPRGSVPGGGTETFSDRAIRCSQQSGMSNVPTGSVGSYMHSCSMGP